MSQPSMPKISKESQIRPTAGFHRTNKLLISIVLFTMGAAFLSLMLVQHRKSEQLAAITIQNRFNERTAYLDSLLKQVTNQLKSMQSLAQADLADSLSAQGKGLPVYHTSIQDHKDDYFHMDASGSGAVGNITGNGSIHNREPGFYREVAMALRLNPLFQSGQNAIQTAAWFYYISARQFINLFPWVTSDQFRFTTDSFQKEFFRLGLPENNPEKGVFWTQVYIDEAGLGLMATCGIPAYDQDGFLGVIAIDLTVDFLNEIVKDFRPERGKMFLVNHRNQLLAHPDLTASKDAVIKTLDNAVPESCRALLTTGDQHSGMIRHDNMLMFVNSLENAPWKAVYIEPAPSPLPAFLNNVGMNNILLALGLLLIAALVLVLSQVLYVTPAEKFVRFILARNKGQKPDSVSQVPRLWKPWFGVVDTTFEKNHEMTQKIRRHGKELETRVRQRTKELEQLNRQLTLEIDDRIAAEHAVRKSEQELMALTNQMEQFSIAAASMLSAKEVDIIFKKISTAIVDHSDYSRVIISIFTDEAPFRDIVGYGGVDAKTIDRLREVELPKTWYDGVLEKGEKIGSLSYYIPHRLKHILNQKATVFGNGPVPDSSNAWHPEDNLFVMMNNEKDQLIGVISVDNSKSGLKPSRETIRPLEIFSSLISQIILTKKEHQHRKQLESQLIQSRKMESIGTLSGGIAHDFNNILSIILGNTELVLHDMPQETDGYNNILEIKNASLRARDIVRQLLSFSRKTGLVKRHLDLGDVISDVMKLIRASIPSSIDIKTRIPSGSKPILADTTQIHQVMINLCSNAADAIGGTGGTISISLENIYLSAGHYPADEIPAGDYFEICISDTGKGMDDATVQNIFDPYFTTKEVGKGTGLGLAVVHGIINDHNGHIRVKSSPGQGSVFKLYLPVSPHDQAPDNKGASKEENPVPTGNETLLIVDDESAIVSMAKKMLEKLGYTVMAYTDPVMAANAFSLSPDTFDLVITDVTMPRMNGLDLALKLKSIKMDIPIIICTGNAEIAGAKNDHNHIVSAYAMKPITVSDIGVLIRQVLDRTKG